MEMIDYSKVDFSKILTRYDLAVQNDSSPEEIAKKMLPTDPVLKAVAECVLYKKIRDITAAMTEALGKFAPDDAINEGLVPGL